MTRPDDIPADVWEKAKVYLPIHFETPDDMTDALTAAIARAILDARAEQREEDARIAEKGEWRVKKSGNWTAAEAEWTGLTGPEIAAAIRNGGK